MEHNRAMSLTSASSTQTCFLMLILLVAWVDCAIEHTQPSWIMVKPGESLTVTCKVTGASITDSSIYWGTAWIRQAAEKPLEWINRLYYTGGKDENNALKNKFSISRDTSRNTVTLQGQNLQAGDTAVYYCARALYYFDYWGKGTHVTVSNSAKAKPSVFPLGQCKPESDGVMTYACMANDFFPESATFQWTKNGQNVLDVVQYPAVKKQSEDKYSKISHITVNSTGMEKQAIRCAVELTNEITFADFPRSPTVSLLPVFTVESQNALCVIENFFPKSLTVTWKKDNAVIKSETPQFIQEDTIGSYTTQSFLKLNKTTQGNKQVFTCEVSHNGKTIKREKILEGQLSVELTPPSSRDIFVNDTAVLKCIITGTDSVAVNDAEVTWKMGGKDQTSKAKVEKDHLGNGQSRKISKLEVDANNWFSGQAIECFVSDKHNGQVQGSSQKRMIEKGGANPEVLIYTLPEARDPNHESVVCEVRGSGDVYIMWQVDGRDYKEGKTGVVEQHDGNKSHVSILTVEKSSKITCAVKHGGMKNYSAPRIVEYSKRKYQECPVCVDK